MVAEVVECFVECAALAFCAVSLVDDHQIARNAQLALAVALDQSVVGGNLDAPEVQSLNIPLLDAIGIRTQVRKHGNVPL
ncbi:hypothetical protein D3C71_1904000 [compost metagenome]